MMTTASVTGTTSTTVYFWKYCDLMVYNQPLYIIQCDSVKVMVYSGQGMKV